MESLKLILDFEKFDDGFVQKLVYDALVWSSLHGLVVGDKTYQIVLMRGFDLQRSGTVPRENDFFKVFGPAFKRNARWSVNTRVLDLGDRTRR
ncbi:glutathione synthetase, chloroplastic isoform X1 [Brassica rapa]|uniref:glutathione synthetase, chloroplastic isoform X1 n=1 Tax=Brassica campestris TaxID=3711 RepID=UPI0004F15ABB|nr:glutathione synthetase, chloroplastic isoform X1 [Brassica rapa]